VPGDRILSAPRHRLLPDSALHPQPARRHPVVGLVLDQRRRQSGARLHRPANSPHVDDPVDRHQRVAAASQLRQGDRRLDVGLSRVRVCRARRVRHGQRLRAAQVRSDEAAARTAARAAGDHDVDDHDCSTVARCVVEGSAARH